MLNIHRIVLPRLAASWLLISLAVGGGLYFHGIQQIDDRIVDLARTASRQISGTDLPPLDGSPADRTSLEKLAADLVRDRFVQIELYDRRHASLTEQVNRRYAAIEAELRQRIPGFAHDQNEHYEQFALGADAVLQVVVPLRDKAGTVAGYLEGVFLVDPETLARLHDELAVTLGVTLATVLLTTLVLYPVILTLNRDVIKFSHDLLQGNIELMEVLGSAIAKRDSDTNIHNYRVSIYAVRLAEAAGLGAAAMRNLIAGAFLHDVGKIGISDNILLKPAKLSDDEFAVMKTHVALGCDILAKSTWLQTARDVVAFHHEKFDGSGYLRGLKGEEIPINARIFAIVDVFDALTSRRPYKVPFPFAEAMAILRRDAGSHFDPKLVDCFDRIAEPLYREVSGAADARIEAMLKDLIARYFTTATPS